MPYWEIISYTCGSIVCPLAIISIICAFCGRRCRKQEAREENVGCWKRIAKCCRKSFTCFSFWKRKNVSRPTPESLEGLLESESGLREASALIVDESEHEDSEENVGCLERVTRFCTSCFCCCQCLWKKSFSLPIPESCEDDQVNRDDISRCSLVDESVENELVDSARGSRKERERKVEKEGKEPVESYHPNSAVEETVSSDSKLETSQNLGETCPVSADTSEGVPLLQPETTQSRSELALSKHEGSATDKQRSKKVRSRKRPLVEDRQRQVSEQDIDGDEPPKCKSLERKSTSIAEESSNVPSSSKKSSAIHNTNKCSTVVEQNEAVKQAHVVDGSEYKNVEKASRHVESEPQIARKTDVKEVRVQIQKHCSSDDGYCSRQTSRQDSQQLGHMESEPQSARKTEFEDIKEVRVQKIQKQSSDSGYCSRQCSRQDSQQLGAEDSWHSVSSTDQTCLVNRQKSADSALGYVPESGSDY